MKIRQTIYQMLMPVAKLYWRVFKPESYGVKALLRHPKDQKKALLVRHTYGDTTLWNLPGGGYNPKKETAALAIERELCEELGIKIRNLNYLCEYHTGGEGKRDTVRLFTGVVQDLQHIELSSEILELEWAEMSTLGSRGHDVARVARRAVEKVLSVSI